MLRLKYLLRVLTILAAWPIVLLGQARTTPQCGDSTYLALKKRPVDSLSARQYEMFRERDKACIASIASDSSAIRNAALTQTGAGVSTDASMLLAMGQADGRSAAQTHGTGGWFAGGFASGIGLGLIGTGIIYAVAANSVFTPTGGEQAALSSKAPVYVQGFNEAYRVQLKSKKKTSALTGGLLGTLTFVVLYVNSQQ